MRFVALLALAVAATFGSSSALVDASYRTTVSVDCNAYDERDSECPPDGCKCELARDGNLADTSRWSCMHDLEDEDCELCFSFAEPQDIVRADIAFYMGSERQRSFYAELSGTDDDTSSSFTSSGDTDYYEYFYLYSDETEEFCIKAKNLGDSEWLSIKEVRIMVD